MRQLHTYLWVPVFFMAGTVFGKCENKSVGIRYSDGTIGIGTLLSQYRYCCERKEFSKEVPKSFKSPLRMQLVNPFNQVDRPYSENKRQEKPPLSSGRIGGELLGGYATGILSGYITYKIIGDYQKKSPEDSGWLGHVLLLYSGFSLGTHIGVYLVGTMGDVTGSYLATLTGGLLGFIGGVVLMPVTFGVSLLILPLVGSIYLFNLTREYDSPHLRETAMINFSNGNIRFHAPEIYFQLSSSDAGFVMPIVHLINTEF